MSWGAALLRISILLLMFFACLYFFESTEIAFFILGFGVCFVTLEDCEQSEQKKKKREDNTNTLRDSVTAVATSLIII